MKKIIDDHYEMEDFIVYLKIYELYNSYLLLISDKKEMGLGNVTLGTPASVPGLKSSSTTYSLFGLKSKLLSDAISKRAVEILKKPLLSLIFISQLETENPDFIKNIMSYINEKLLKIEQD